MKYIIFLFSPLLFLYGCSVFKKTTGGRAATSSVSSNSALVRIKNNSSFAITRVSIDNGGEEQVVYSEIAPGKTSEYKAVKSLCNCGYKIDIWYKKGAETFSILKDCVNVMPCTDYFKGKVMIDLTCENPATLEASLNFKQE